MLTFRPVTRRSVARLRRYYKNCDYELCEYSAGVKLMWREALRPCYAEAAGCLISYSILHDTICFDFPVALPEGDIEAALDEMEAYCVEHELPLVISVVPERFLPLLGARYPRFRLRNHRAWGDYVYLAEDLREFAGRRYSGQRNHINKFRKLYPEAAFRALGKGDMPLVEGFWADYEREFSKQGRNAGDELRFAKSVIYPDSLERFCVGGMELDGRLISLCLAERCADVLIIHVEKALGGYEGVYPATVQAFAQHFAGAGVRFINREDDADDPGLRTSKRQYLPDHMGAKLRFDVENELYALADIPTLTTPRLTLDALTDADRAAYNALCRNDERNRYWGYDYRADCKGEPDEDYFLRVTREDFRKHTAVSFAVRLDGKCIGEAILYHFDGKGGAELGCRIDPAYAGNGYGTEAFAAVASWGLYRLHLAHVTAKCFRENDASFRMLSACMRKVGEDETYFYFDKEI